MSDDIATEQEPELTIQDAQFLIEVNNITVRHFDNLIKARKWAEDILSLKAEPKNIDEIEKKLNDYIKHLELISQPSLIGINDFYSPQFLKFEREVAKISEDFVTDDEFESSFNQLSTAIPEGMQEAFMRMTQTVALGSEEDKNKDFKKGHISSSDNDQKKSSEPPLDSDNTNTTPPNNPEPPESRWSKVRKKAKGILVISADIGIFFSPMITDSILPVAGSLILSGAGAIASHYNDGKYDFNIIKSAKSGWGMLGIDLNRLRFW